MIKNFEKISHSEEIRADLCIIGGGAAGIALALEFCDTDLNVALIESGGFNINRSNQELYSAINVGVEYKDLSVQRGRYFGGTTNLWGGNCIPLSSVDYVTRDSRRKESWPISSLELKKYQSRAQQVLGIAKAKFGEDLITKLEISDEFESPASFRWNAWQFCKFPYRFGQVFRKRLANCSNVTVFLNANLVDITLGRSGNSITQGAIRSLHGRQAQISAKYFVLATGGIENSRLLLNFKDKLTPESESSLSNIGRYFSEHPNATIGTITGKDAGKIYEQHKLRLIECDQEVKPCWEITQDAQDRLQTLNGVLSIWPIQKENKVITRAKLIMSLLRRREFGFKFLVNVFLAIPGIIELLPHVVHRIRVGQLDIPIHKDIFELRLMSEAKPNIDSMVRLSSKRDTLGMRQAELNWQLDDFDRESFTKIATEGKQAIESMGEVEVKLEDWILDRSIDWKKYINKQGHYGHHMGTTRMAKDEKEGVVNTECQVHGCNNLYVAGSSVFPTYGFANPTLTIVSLAIRLADHLKRKLA